MAKLNGFVIGVAVGAAIVGGLVVVLTLRTFPDLGGGTSADTTTGIFLDVESGRCTVDAKEPEVHVDKGKQVTWRVWNNCRGKGTQKVALGNFRLVEKTAETDCSKSTNGVDWPFKRQDETRRETDVPEGAYRDIVLKEAKNTDGRPATYFFDVCVGGVIALDPRLVIEP
jgi:hypothetical protein